MIRNDEALLQGPGADSPEVRERHGWSTGSELWIEDRDDPIVLRAAPEPPESTLDEIAGATGYRGPRKNLEQMDAGIAEGASVLQTHPPIRQL